MRKSKRFAPFDWILFGLIVHSIGALFLYISNFTCYFLSGIGLFIIFYNIIFKIPFSKPIKGFALFIFYIYLIWSAIIILRPFFNSEPFTKDGFSLINAYTWLSYLTPIIAFISFKQASIKSIFRFCLLQGVIGIILLVFNFHIIFPVNRDFGSDEYLKYVSLINIPLQFLSASAFMVLSYEFASAKYRIIGFSTLLLSLFLALFSARRGNVFMNLVILLFTFYLYAIASKKGSKLLKICFVASTILFGLGIFSIYSNSAFSFFISRLDDDTRSGMEESFFYSFKNNSLDWIIGRGINGTYYCPVCATASNRGEIETGYMYIILKGGIILLSLFIILLTYSAFLGLFRTQNIMSKAMSLYLIAHILYLIPFGIPAFNFEYFVLWLCIFYCQSRKFRMLFDSDIKNQLKIGY